MKELEIRNKIIEALTNIYFKKRTEKDKFDLYEFDYEFMHNGYEIYIRHNKVKDKYRVIVSMYYKVRFPYEDIMVSYKDWAESKGFKFIRWSLTDILYTDWIDLEDVGRSVMDAMIVANDFAQFMD